MMIESRTAGITPKCHSVNIIESNTPRSAIIDPTESSIPPVMITIPRPMLKMPNAPICLARFCKLIGRRKFGLTAATTIQRTIRSTKMPSSFFIGLSCGSSCQMHYRLLAELWPFENPRYSSFMHDCNAIADAQHFFHFTADYNYGHALGGKFANQPVDFGFSAYVNSTGWLV